MFQVERTGRGLNGETRVKIGANTCVFQRDADVSLTDYGTCVIERGLATSRITYWIDKQVGTNGTLLDNLVALRIQRQDCYRGIIVHDFHAAVGTIYRVERQAAMINVFKTTSCDDALVQGFSACHIECIMAEQVATSPSPMVRRV